MREIDVQQITDVVEKLCIEANQFLPEDVQCAIKNCRGCEDWEIAQGFWTILLPILRLPKKSRFRSVDTGMACVFLEIGRCTSDRW